MQSAFPGACREEQSQKQESFFFFFSDQGSSPHFCKWQLVLAISTIPFRTHSIFEPGLQ